MDKLNLAVFFGGCSPEYGVSLQSAHAVLTHLDLRKYRPVMVGITKDGRWFHFTGDVEKIPADRWQDPADCTPALLSPDRGARQLLALRENAVERIPLDAAFPVIHGQNGEDGTLQGLIELAGIPLVGCGTLASALCMDKDRAHRLAAAAGVQTPRALVTDGTGDAARRFADAAGWPVFVKPVRAGSSYGVTRVEGPEQLDAALALALQYDSRAIVEEAIPGFEVGCAVLGNRELTVGEVDEIELSRGFFDFTEKYTLKTSSIHLPARVVPQKTEEIKQLAKTVYRALGCSGFARVDLFLKPDGQIVFNEVNTIPGFTAHSRYPGMMQAAGISFPSLLDRLIRQAVEE